MSSPPVLRMCRASMNASTFLPGCHPPTIPARGASSGRAGPAIPSIGSRGCPTTKTLLPPDRRPRTEAAAWFRHTSGSDACTSEPMSGYRFSRVSYSSGGMLFERRFSTCPAPGP
ncbi:MAG: hypothetical protein BWX47_01134 [candidate division Hyd24-12 bacterium ADurb.Bin004]|nr:MAG: hypothetical protein BWX47_01134 [candidate division Hyd24-12 bacterium ADurb.Bin004]